ncbi:hypothetical protein GEV33_013436 [Tenebrio molitor]|uniref:Uncharacterized protein n=1 Tax=Tenebrio molitor TaxID=7067 RepID=A0A8J6H7W7_TENMO|nr:hypothetical protein GEV33_013436 [Tenebrio molitor]
MCRDIHRRWRLLRTIDPDEEQTAEGAGGGIQIIMEAPRTRERKINDVRANRLDASDAAHQLRRAFSGASSDSRRSFLGDRWNAALEITEVSPGRPRIAASLKRPKQIRWMYLIDCWSMWSLSHQDPRRFPVVKNSVSHVYDRTRGMAVHIYKSPSAEWPSGPARREQ